MQDIFSSRFYPKKKNMHTARELRNRHAFFSDRTVVANGLQPRH